jgi:P27 family predicted phage terminase small subunit
MTPRGRKPLPTNIKKLRGTWRPDRGNANEPKVQPGVPEPPEWLSADALAEWRRIVPQLKAAGLLTRLDLAVLVGYVTAWADLCEATRNVAGHGTTYVSPRGTLVLHPELRRIEKARAALRAFASEFGLSPSARARVGASPPPEDDEDEARRRKFFPALTRGGRA